MVLEVTEKSWPAEGLEYLHLCPVCGSRERKTLYSDLTDRTFFCAPGYWDLHQCTSCHSAYLDPRPTTTTISLAYESYYTHEDFSQVEKLSLLRRWRQALGNGYRNWKYGTKYRPATRLGILAPLLAPRFPSKVAQSMYFLPRSESGQRLLDVGCGNGAFLMRAASAGWQVAGVDQDPKAVAIAQQAGLEVRQGGIEAIGDSEEKFDAVTMSHILEHVHDPVGALQRAHTLLRAGGTLYIETPNIDAQGHQRFREHWRGLEIPRHLVLFNWDSLNRLLFASGFSAVKTFARSTPYRFIAGQSRAIQKNVDPYLHSIPRMSDKLRAISMEIPGGVGSHRAEFITLHAYK